MADAPTKKIRVLIATGDSLPNHVLTLPAKDADAAVKAGWACDDADGIAYAEKNEPQPEPAADEAKKA